MSNIRIVKIREKTSLYPTKHTTHTHIYFILLVFPLVCFVWMIGWCLCAAGERKTSLTAYCRTTKASKEKALP